MTTNDNEWQQLTTSDTAIDSEWQQVVKQLKTNESKWKRVILGSEWNKICNLELKYIQEYRLFINLEIDDIYFQYNILCFYHASISACFSASALLKFLEAC